MKIDKKYFEPKRLKQRIIIVFPDKSKIILSKIQKRAIELKTKINIEKVKKIIVLETLKHWKSRTVPTKFDFDRTWERELESNYFLEGCLKFQKDTVKEFEKKFGKDSYPDVVVHKESELGILGEDKKAVLFDSKENKYLEKLHTQEFKKAQEYAKKMAIKNKKEAEFKDMAELGNTVFYQMFRPAIMGLMFASMSEGKGKVIALSDGGRTKVYGGKR